MVLEIELGCKKEKRLKKHLEVEHPSTRGKMRLSHGNKKFFNRMIANTPRFDKQAEEFTQL